MTSDQDIVRRAVRVPAEGLLPGDRIAPWGDTLTPHRKVHAVTPSEHGTVLVEWDDNHEVTRYHRWAIFHAKNRRPNLHRPERTTP